MKQFMQFAFIGAIGTAGHYLTLIVMVELFSTDTLIATTLGFVVGAIINYILNYKITFDSDKPHHIAASKFFIVAIIGAGINALIMYLLIEHLLWHYLLAQLLATLIVLIWNFIINKLWTFSGNEMQGEAR